MRSRVPSKKKRAAPEIKSQNNAFPLVAIGASAGGLEAVTQFLSNLPPDIGMAFIYLQHLAQDYKSRLVEILSKSTPMKVQETANNVRIQPDTIYVVSPDKEMHVKDGKIKLTSRKDEPAANHLPIDRLFYSLASYYKDKAIGIIFSGNATDGTYGSIAIKREGGLTFAQDESAKFNSMPKSAIDHGAIDFILPPDQIARELVHISKHVYMNSVSQPPGKGEETMYGPADLKNVYQALYKETGVDFSLYKLATVRRRVARRMVLCKKDTLREYGKLLSHKRDEAHALFRDLLINVTSFFRDIPACEYLKTQVFPRLLKTKKAGEPLRIWVPACSTGEEAYSLAMILLEIQGDKFSNIPVQVFATDLSDQAIGKARIGEYSKHDIGHVSSRRLQRFFTKSDGVYRVVKAVRDMCVFAPHNLLGDPPFSRIDFISCCNLLIYLEANAQKKAIAAFHYALQDEGLLMLGRSESIGSSTQLFSQANKKFKIYSRKKNKTEQALSDFSFHFPPDILAKKKDNRKNEKIVTAHSNGIDKEIDAVLLSRYVPASVVITHDMEVIQFRGSTALYLEHSPGKASLNLLKMVRPEIAFELRSTIHKAITTKQKVRKPDIEIKLDSASRRVSLEVVPLKIKWEEPLLLIVFNEQEKTEMYVKQSKGTKATPAHKERRIKKLEEELAAAYSNMRSLSEEQETANEELQSSNEEIVSSNEELQSLNEELETSKEEIESANEELITTNQELRVRNEMLTEAHNYSEAILDTVHEPMIVLDKHLRVKSANRAFYKKFQMDEEKTAGMLIYELGNKEWDIPDLRDLLKDVVFKNTDFHGFEITHNFSSIGKKTMLLNARRIVQKSHQEQLILLAIVDFTEPLLQRLKEHNTSLEKAVKERTFELEESRQSFETKNIQLSNMNRELASFAFVASHDLQEPLRKIRIFSSRIVEKEKKQLSDKGKEYFLAMQESAKKMQNIIDCLLSYSRMNSTPKLFVKTDLTKIVEEIKKELQGQLEKNKAIIKCSSLGKLRVIPLQFRQLMRNLIENALKFSRPGILPRISIKSKVSRGSTLQNRKLLPNRSYCCISVKDNGLGFEPKFSERIFEVFQRLNAKEDFEGVGLGLSICRKIADNHEGAITATGDLNKGATFHVYLPV